MEMRLRTGKRIIVLLESLLAAQEALEYKASRDSLTGLWNRSAILGILESELNRVSREKQSVSVILIDIDYFKSINDTHGHLCGDSVLREVAERALGSIRSYDSLGRLGGDEFLLVAPESEQQSVEALAERIRASIGDTEFRTPECNVSVTVSIGIATAPSGVVTKVEALIRAADEALYRGKRRGRNRVKKARVEV
jgi:diguanylate cyclase (GGDEF)-like protein